MKNQTLMFIVSALAILGTIGETSAALTEEGAEEAKDGSNAAELLNGVSCLMRTRPEAPLNQIVTTDSLVVIPSSGQVTLVCHGEVEPGSVEPFTQSGFPCGLGPFGSTTRSHVVWTPSGQGTLTCHSE